LSRHDDSTVLRILQSSTVFRDETGQGFASLCVGHQTVTVELNSKRKGTCVAITRAIGARVSQPELDSIIESLAEKAATSPVRQIFVRVGHTTDSIIVDLGGDESQVVLVNYRGWELTEQSPVPFRRPKGMLALPTPSRNNGNLLAELAPVVGSLGREQQILIAAYLIGALNSNISEPVLELVGTQGSGKSTLAKALRGIVDPNTAPCRRVSRDERDLFIAGGTNWMLSLENLSSISPWLSDALCAIATGAGYATRRLYEDDEEVVFSVRRPVIVNAIHEVILRPDLRDRAVSIRLPAMESTTRKTEAEFWAAFRASQPRILGALLECVSNALLFVDAIRPARLPRMADWFKFVLAAAEGGNTGFEPAEFEQIYLSHQAEGNQISIDASPIGRTLFALAEANPFWTGTLSKLLSDLTSLTQAQDRPKDWPRIPESLRHAIDRILPSLAAEGVDIQFHRATTRLRERQVVIRYTGGRP
jgi:putative DNA primase/helicase